jgi:ribulose-phosphate 3-epimerase
MSKNRSQVKIAASVLAADFRCLREEVAAVERAGVDLLHLDIMDGSFVPNISFGPLLVKAIDSLTEMPLDVHLMIQRPDLYAAQFAQCGADIIVMHYESHAPLDATMKLISDLGCRTGLSLNPTTPLEVAEPFLDRLDQVLLMSVNPGFGGQQFIPSAAHKVQKLRQMLDERENRRTSIAVDGGVNSTTAAIIRNSGADILVAGSAIFGSKDYREAVLLLRGEKRSGDCSRS